MLHNFGIDYSTLHNDYYAQRHGLSVANVEDVLANTPYRARAEFGLTEGGRTQVRQRILELVQRRGNGIQIISSDLRRTIESALIDCEVLEQNPTQIKIDPNLRERDCGDLEGCSVVPYMQRIITRDRVNPTHTHLNVESLVALMRRGLTVIERLETKFRGKTFLLVSHRETIHMLLCALYNINPATHNEVFNIQNGEIVHLNNL
jgi:broad specificity phosphatase PhoE